MEPTVEDQTFTPEVTNGGQQEIFSAERLLNKMKQKALKKLEEIKKKLNNLAEDQLQRTEESINLIFEIYENPYSFLDEKGIDVNNLNIFLVPPRGNNSAEAKMFLPIAEVINFEDPAQVKCYMELLSCLPPIPIAYYKGLDNMLVIVIPVDLVSTYKLFRALAEGDPLFFKTRLLWRLKKDRNKRIFLLTKLLSKFPSTPFLGLGATLPGLFKYGQLLEYPTTTGHAGTVNCILRLVESLRKDQELNAIVNGNQKPKNKIGVIGLGRIGKSVVEILAEDMIVYDSRKEKSAEMQNREKVTVAENWLDVFKKSKIVVLAITTPLDFEKLYWERVAELKRNYPSDEQWIKSCVKQEFQMALDGAIIIDDSEPGAVTPSSIEFLREMGIIITVIKPLAGIDNSPIIRSTFDDEKYDLGLNPTTLPDKTSECIMYGCEFEVYIRSMFINKIKEILGLCNRNDLIDYNNKKSKDSLKRLIYDYIIKEERKNICYEDVNLLFEYFFSSYKEGLTPERVKIFQKVIKILEQLQWIGNLSYPYVTVNGSYEEESRHAEQ
ncbi:MAG: hypothetical protein KatS3mg085_100 [Candidatus Dojkabacteria bacterium]|nr:MAG: hypothetical protein KatS3mg085_100 [Candidatus Dojkabacteria bacterium]